GMPALTLLPAILALLGRIPFIPFIPRTEEMIEKLEKKKNKKIRRPKPSHRIDKKIGGIVTEKPWMIIIVSVVILGGLSSFVPKMQFTYGLLDSFRVDRQSEEGFDLIEDHHPPGEVAPVSVIVDTEGVDISLDDSLKNVAHVESVDDPEAGAENEQFTSWSATYSSSPGDSEA